MFQGIFNLSGAHHLLKENNTINAGADEDDLLEEGESLLNSLDIDEIVNSTDPSQAPFAANLDRMEASLAAASENVIVQGTLRDYRRYGSRFLSSLKTLLMSYDIYFRLWESFIAFGLLHRYIKDRGEVENSIGCWNPNIPTWISVWIMNSADEDDIQTGKPKPPNIPRSTYAHAQKMRAAMSHKFGRDFKQGAKAWEEQSRFEESCLIQFSIYSQLNCYLECLHWKSFHVTSGLAIYGCFAAAKGKRQCQTSSVVSSNFHDVSGPSWRCGHQRTRRQLRYTQETL